MKLLFLAAVLLVAVEGRAVNECIWGPSYWCQSRDIASTCGKVDYCAKNVWKDTATKVTDAAVQSLECTLCQDIVGVALHYVESNTTKTELEAELKQVCNYLGSLEAECKDVVDETIDAIWNAVQNGVTPTGVCQDVQLCTTDSTTALMVGSPQTPLDCKICDFVAKLVVITTHSDSSKDDIKAGLIKACAIPEPVESECIKFVNSHFDKVWEMVSKKSESPEMLCAQLMPGTCPSPPTFTVVHKRNIIECEGCKLIIKHFLDEDKIKDKLDQVCNSLDIPADDQAKCTAILNDILNFTWNDFNFKDPKTVCQDLDICSKSNLLTSALALYTTIPQVKQPADDALCDLCKLAANYLKTFVDSNTSESEAKSALETFCGLLPGNFSSECDGFISKYFFLVWPLVKKEVDSDDLCKMIGLCPNSTALRIKPIAKKQMISKVGGATGCTVCKLAVGLLDKYINNNTTKNEAEQEIEHICSLLPSNLQDLCNATISSNFDEIWNLIQQETDPDVICSAIGLCTGSKRTSSLNKLAKPKVKTVKNIVECDLCIFLVGELKKIIVNNSTEGEAEAALETVCNILPSSAQTQCINLINAYFPQIWEKISEEADPETVCTEIGLCTSLKIAAVKKTPLQSTECSLCKSVVNLAIVYVDNNNTEQELLSGLEGLCNYLGSLSSECTELVDTYFPDIWNLVQQELNATVICEQLGLCDSKLHKHITKPQPLKLKADSCAICELIEKFLQPYVDSNVTKGELKDALESLCNLLPSSFGSECTGFVDEYFSNIWDAIQDEFNSDTICKTIGACSSTRTNRIGKVLPIKKHKQIQAPQESIPCQVCQFIVPFVKPYVDSNSTEEEVKSALDQICSFLPTNYADECTKVVDNNFTTIWNRVRNEVDNNVICQDLNLCTGISHKPIKKEQGPITCFLCGLLMSEVEKLVNTSNAENVTIGILEKACDVIPAAYRNDCISLVETRGKEIIEVIINTGAKSVCAVIGLCAVDDSRAYTVTTVGSDCNECQSVLNLLKNAMKYDPTLFDGVLSDFCQEMPDSIKDECTDLVKQFASAIINITANAINPEALCKDIKVCQYLKKSARLLSTDKLPLLPVIAQPKNRPVQDTECDACVQMFEEMEVLIPKKSDEILKAIQEGCEKYLPMLEAGVCDFLVTELGDQLIDDIALHISPRTDCIAIGVCSSVKKSPSLAKPWLSLKPIN